MNDDRLMKIAARVDPVATGSYDGLATGEWGRRTFAEIVATGVSGPRWTRRIAVTAGIAAVLACALVVAVPERHRPRTEAAFAPELTRLAEAAPRLLVRGPGWEVVRADGLGEDTAEMGFANDRYWVDLYWYPGNLYDRYVDDRRSGADDVARLEVAGGEAIVFRHDGTEPAGTTFYALWREGQHVVELRTDVVPTVAELRAIAASIEVVDADTWLAALPATVVPPDERRRAIDQLVAGVPLPPAGLGELARSEVVASESSLEHAAATAIVCGWLDHWATGDDVARKEAADALAGAAGWGVFSDGGMALEYVEDVAAAMAGGERLDGGGSGSSVSGYRRHVGCDEES